MTVQGQRGFLIVLFIMGVSHVGLVVSLYLLQTTPTMDTTETSSGNNDDGGNVTKRYDHLNGSLPGDVVTGTDEDMSRGHPSVETVASASDVVTGIDEDMSRGHPPVETVESASDVVTGTDEDMSRGHPPVETVASASDVETDYYDTKDDPDANLVDKSKDKIQLPSLVTKSPLRNNAGNNSHETPADSDAGVYEPSEERSEFTSTPSTSDVRSNNSEPPQHDSHIDVTEESDSFMEHVLEAMKVLGYTNESLANITSDLMDDKSTNFTNFDFLDQLSSNISLHGDEFEPFDGSEKFDKSAFEFMDLGYKAKRNISEDFSESSNNNKLNATITTKKVDELETSYSNTSSPFTKTYLPTSLQKVFSSTPATDEMFVTSKQDIVNVNVTSNQTTCSNSDGWNLRGDEWGCCGNYDGCCIYASMFCYLHDVVCKCCERNGGFCGPTCKPEADCFKQPNATLQKPTLYTQSVASDSTSVNNQRHSEGKKDSNFGSDMNDALNDDGSGETEYSVLV